MYGRSIIYNLAHLLHRLINYTFKTRTNNHDWLKALLLYLNFLTRLLHDPVQQVIQVYNTFANLLIAKMKHPLHECALWWRRGRMLFPYLFQLCRCPDPGAQIPTSKCCVFPCPRWWCKRQHNNALFILVPAAGPYVQQRGCARALYYLAPGVLVVEGTSEAREGGRLPSLC